MAENEKERKYAKTPTEIAFPLNSYFTSICSYNLDTALDPCTIDDNLAAHSTNTTLLNEIILRSRWRHITIS